MRREPTLGSRPFLRSVFNMNNPNDVLDSVIFAVQTYCEVLQAEARTSERRVVASDVRNVMNQALPELSRRIGLNLPDLVFVEDMIGCGVSGLKNKSMTLLWDHHFLAGGLITEVAELANYHPRSIHRQKRVFAHRIAVQLWKRNFELADSSVRTVPQPQTVRQLRIEILRRVFHLTEREAEVVLAFCQAGPERGRKTIAYGLGVSVNTLKAHQHTIIGKMHAGRMNEAAEQAIQTLKQYPAAEWTDDDASKP